MRAAERKAPGRGGTGRQGEHFDGALASDHRPADRLLSRLEHVRETGPGRWIGRCPSHQDRSPSLSVRELGDGTVLLKCFAGCAATDVVAAVGLELRHLFPERHDHRQRPIPRRDRWAPRDILRCLATETFIVLLASEDVAAGKVLSDEDRDRLALAVTRVRRGAREAGLDV